MAETRKDRLLILDDESAIGQTIALIARGTGLDAVATDCADDFFRELDAWQPTHIALDLIMPGLDGVEIMRLLAERGCRARIVITSGVGGRVLSAARRTADEHGLNVVGVMAKPFSPQELRALLQSDGRGRTSESVETIAPAQFQPAEADLRRALEKGELEVAYQPFVECSSRKLAGFEALVRWRHPSAGLILPERFIPLAETTGLIDLLTEQVVDQSLRWFSQCFQFSSLTLSVNISPRSLLNLDLGDRALKLSRRHGIAPERLTFELTESSAMEDAVKSLHLMTRLRTQGFQLSIDDFGTGYSSMLQLVRLPFSEIKVDKSFVMAAMQTDESRTLIKSIVDLGHSLGLRAVAEGVEDLATLDFLNKLGCDRAQGFYIARPMQGSEVEDWAKSWTSQPRLKRAI
jgi:EAL domain-containing protein (putative c-di-GMP-specific phosphodiesterase class I)